MLTLVGSPVWRKLSIDFIMDIIGLTIYKFTKKLKMTTKTSAVDMATIPGMIA
jgi:hypothetical protein